MGYRGRGNDRLPGLAYALITLVVRRLSGSPPPEQPCPPRRFRYGREGSGRRLCPNWPGRYSPWQLWWRSGGPGSGPRPVIVPGQVSRSGVVVPGHQPGSGGQPWHDLFRSRRNPARAMLGWALGSLAALAGAAVLVQLSKARAVVMPLVMVLRSVPLIAMTPLIALVFGQGLLASWLWPPLSLSSRPWSL